MFWKPRSHPSFRRWAFADSSRQYHHLSRSDANHNLVTRTGFPNVKLALATRSRASGESPAIRQGGRGVRSMTIRWSGGGQLLANL